jgi:hypothetical protein
MAHGVKKGEVDSQFEKRVEELEEAAKNMADQFRQFNSYRLWHTPKGTGDLLDVPALHMPAWERNKINELYSETILAGTGEESGTCGDLIAMKWQADFMAVEERAFRLRHASYARCAALMHGRMKGHGTAKTGIFSFLKEAVQAHIDAGGMTGGFDGFTGDISGAGGVGMA